MNPAADTGRRGERAAVEHLRREGYTIRDVNWRSGRYELDIVAERRGVLHFVEVKTRRAGGLTPPEQAITPGKCRALRNAATHYLALAGEGYEVQFDLAAVDEMPDGRLCVRMVEHAVEYGW